MFDEWDIPKDKDAWDAMIRDAASVKGLALSGKTASEVLDDLPTIFPIGRISTVDTLSGLSDWLLYTGARYGLDTRVTIQHMLSAFTEMARHTPNIVERQRSAMSYLRVLETTSLVSRDKLDATLIVLNIAGRPRVKWEAEVMEGGIIRVRSRFA